MRYIVPATLLVAAVVVTASYLQGPVDGTLFAATSTVSVSNTATEGTLIGSGVGVEFWGMTNSPDVVINTTVPHVVNLTAVWSTADAGASIFGTNFILEGL